jgi:hypothetical protein
MIYNQPERSGKIRKENISLVGAAADTVYEEA